MKFRSLLLATALLMGGAICALAQSTPDDPKPQATPDTPPQSQSLADIARADRAAAKTSGKVFTNDDIATAHPEDAAAPKSKDKDADAQDADKSGDAADDKAEAKKPPEESIEVKGAKKVVEAKTIQIDAVTNEVHKLEFKLANATTPDDASNYAQQIQNLQHNLQVWRNVRDDAQKVVDAAKPKPQDAQQSPATPQPEQ
jgi:hypothetical protein